MIKAEKPAVLFGISPFGIPRPGQPKGVVGFDQYDKLYADTVLWLNKGWCDYFSPQLYWKIDAPGQPFRPLLNHWIQENKSKRHIWPGLSSSRVGTGEKSYAPEELLGQVEIIRQTPGSTGEIFFSMRSLMEDKRGFADRLKTDLNGTPALIPASPGSSSPAPGATPGQSPAGPSQEPGQARTRHSSRARCPTVPVHRLRQTRRPLVRLTPSRHQRPTRHQ